MATKRKLIVTGDRQLTKWLNSLEAKTARKLHRTAAKTAAKLVLAEAKNMVPKDTGKYAKALKVYAIRRSRTQIGWAVSQKASYAKPSKTIKEGGKAYYGVFQELGWTIGGRTRKRVSKSGQTISTVKRQNRRNMKKTSKPMKLKKVPGGWFVRRAGIKMEPRAIALYHSELENLLRSQ